MKPKLAEFDAGIKDIKSLTSNKGKLTLEYDKDQRNITLSELMEFEQALFTGYNGIEKHLTHSLIYAI
ncbi:MAG TPA: hypothetical protein VHA74_02315, partial [Candidatus Dojkabacteria bacterium]|nr:hypothetical protein [Candidatus Dojkabacteria bacterium]